MCWPGEQESEGEEAAEARVALPQDMGRGNLAQRNSRVRLQEVRCAHGAANPGPCGCASAEAVRLPLVSCMHLSTYPRAGHIR